MTDSISICDWPWAMPTEIEKSKQASSLTFSLKTLETSAIPCSRKSLTKLSRMRLASSRSENGRMVANSLMVCRVEKPPTAPKCLRM